MRLIAAAFLTIAALLLTGCPNPNAIGVQVYGTIKAVVTDAGSGQPIAGALVNAGSNNSCSTQTDGTCVLTQVPVGKWTVIANYPGLHGSTDVTVTENNQSTANVAMTP